MMPFFLFSLFFTLLTVLTYIVKGAHSRAHRLLPLVLGLIALYNFYEIILFRTGNRAIFIVLEDLLLLQMMYLIYEYIRDFLHAKPSILQEAFMFAVLVYSDVRIFVDYAEPARYQTVFQATVILYFLLLMGMAGYTYLHSNYTGREQMVTNLLFLSFVVPALVLLLRKWGTFTGAFPILLSLDVTVGIMLFLIVTDQLMDPAEYMQTEAFESSKIATVLVDAQYYFLEANEAAARLFSGKDVGNIFSLKKNPDYREQVRQFIEDEGESRIYSKEERYYEYHVSPVYYRKRKEGYIIHILDITEQQKETRQALAMKEAAELETLLKSQFMARMTHDLRSPLHAIIGLSDIMIGRREIMEKNRTMAKHINQAGKVLLSLVNSILDYSKLEAGKMELKEEEYSFADLLKEQTYQALVNVGNKPIEVRSEIVGKYPDTLCGDELRIREIVQNLISNAVKFTEAGHVFCQVVFQSLGEGGWKIQVSVEDTGTGMTPDQLKRAFSDYVSFADCKTLEGSGLGLPIVKQLCEMMGGDTLAESDGRSGSQLTVSFCQKEGTHAAMREGEVFSSELLKQQTDSPGDGISPSWIYPKARILIADDMEVNLEIFREMVEPWQMKVVVAVDGQNAVERCRNDKFDLIFLDQMMPVMTGDEATLIIQGRQAYQGSTFGEPLSLAPVIKLSANVSEADEEEFQTAGYTDVLQKPIDKNKLKEIIEGLLPEELREPAPIEWMNQKNLFRKNIQSYRKSLESFRKELEKQVEELPVLMREDLSLFCIKVHGIKGTAKQLDRYSLSEKAEILEMASKLNRIPFIENHLSTFLEELRESSQDIAEEIQHLPVVEQDSSPQQEEQLWDSLKKALDQYHMHQVEDALESLQKLPLEEEKKELLGKILEVWEDMDYEAGLELIEAYEAKHREATD